MANPWACTNIPAPKLFSILPEASNSKDGGLAAMEHPDVAVRVRSDVDYLPPLDLRRKLRPIFDCPIRIRQVVGGTGIDLSARRDDRDNQYRKPDSRPE
jgi:hypothetical protein